ncbi:MAG: DUF1028 domain-containing protein, partial [Proteobacteria bacterium]|nr:DUF1028 domain-containing protein [Pseudomonadota bacterium]
MTFAVLARCLDTGDIGVAIASTTQNIGDFAPMTQSGIGAVAVMGVPHPELRQPVLDAMADGLTAHQAALQVLSGLPNPAGSMIAAIGPYAAPICVGGVSQDGWDGLAEWTGNLAGSDWVVAGNRLAGLDVLKTMAS